MSADGGMILVLGATGQQGGSVAEALLARGWKVRALVRDPSSARSQALQAKGAELVQGDLADRASMRPAMAGVHEVFSVQPSSGQGATYGVSDEDEVRYGVAVADLASELGVRHLVYSSANGTCQRHWYSRIWNLGLVESRRLSGVRLSKAAAGLLCDPGG